MKKAVQVAAIIFLFLAFFSCSVEPLSPPPSTQNSCVVPNLLITSTSSREFDDSVLTQLSKLVLQEAQSNFCQRGDLWGIAAVGAKACGGPASYMAYKKYNEKCFLKVLERYNQQMQVFNKKYLVISTCDVVPKPASVICQGGQPVLVY